MFQAISSKKIYLFFFFCLLKFFSPLDLENFGFFFFFFFSLLNQKLVSGIFQQSFFFCLLTIKQIFGIFSSTFSGNFQLQPLQVCLCHNFFMKDPKSHNFFNWKFDPTQTFVILYGNFGQLLVGIFNCNHFRCVCEEKSQLFHESSIRLKFRHFVWQFWSTFSGNFQLQPLQVCLWGKVPTFSRKFDPTQISSFWMAILVNF